MKERTIEQYTADAETYCARAERAPLEVISWLTRRGATREQSRSITENLKESGFIDERRFTAAFACDKLRFDGWGPNKIAYTLRAKGIDEELISQIIPTVMADEDAPAILHTLLLRRIASLPNEEITPDMMGRKVVQWAVNRGFPIDDVLGTLQKIRSEAD